MPMLPRTPFPTTCRVKKTPKKKELKPLKAHAGGKLTRRIRATNLDFGADFDRFLEAAEGAERGYGLSANRLQLGQLPAAAAAVLQDALSILPNLGDEHQGSGQHLLPRGVQQSQSSHLQQHETNKAQSH